MGTLVEKELVSGIPKCYSRSAFGNLHCPGCHYSLAERAICEAVEEMGLDGQTVSVIGVGCCATCMQLLNFDAIFSAHGRAPDVATAVKRVSPKLLAFTLQGDGDTISIGAEALINAAVRAEKITVLMINNANYGMTGGQLAPTTLMGQVTSTTTKGRDPSAGYPIHVAELLAGIKGVAYSARTSFHTPANFQKTKKYLKTAFQKQMDSVGMSFVEMLSACPPNWHLTPMKSLEWIENTMIAEFPLGEFKNVDRIE